MKLPGSVGKQPRKLALELPAIHAAVRQARNVVRSFARMCGLPGREVETLMLVASELLGNAVDHGGGGGAMDEGEMAGSVRMVLRLEFSGQSWSLEVDDQGGGDPAEVQELYRKIIGAHGESAATWVPVVGGIVQRLGRLYFNNRGNFAFPYAYLIDWLEQETVVRQIRAGQCGRHNDWLRNVLVDHVKVPYKHVYDAYLGIDVDGWAGVGGQLSLAKLLIFQARYGLVDSWLRHVEAIVDHARLHERHELRELAPLLRDHILELIPDVAALHVAGDPNFDRMRDDLNRDLHELNARLDRFAMRF